MESAALGAPPPAPTHRLRALRSFLFPEPNLKAPPLDCLSIGSPLCVVTTEGAYSRLAGGGWLYSKHLQPIAAASPDFVATALEFLGRSEEHPSELQSLMRTSYAVFCLTKKNT